MTAWGRGPRTRHIVWDWNGTLLADNHAVLAAVNAVCSEFGRAAITLDEWREMFSRPLHGCYERLLNRRLDHDDWVRIDSLYHERYRDLLGECGLAAGVPHLLHDWAAAGGTQSLLSMWFHAELVPLVSELGLAGLFTRIDGLRVDLGGGSKTEHFVEHLYAQGLDPADVVLIGDVTDDAHAAHSAGANCVLVTTGIMSRSALDSTGAPVVDSIPEALSLIRRESAA
ncbi:phosphatase [Longimycelium tulufanense]|uniref:Phosphatase n=1 Tax=Longimycelium tulufanense TaxID=907463 RepID=A0A8J3FVY2_9PSEU|nr:HAD family hydrolase [Longimycelium tulufanense]GGM61826.1 phosphatase [Longimycelium tulufanense]